MRPLGSGMFAVLQQAVGAARVKPILEPQSSHLSWEDFTLQPFVVRMLIRRRKACNAVCKLAVGGRAQGANILFKVYCVEAAISDRWHCTS